MQTDAELIQALRTKLLDQITKTLELSAKNKELRRQLLVSRYNTRKQKRQTKALLQDNCMLEEEMQRLAKINYNPKTREPQP